MSNKHILFSVILFLSVHFAWSQADCSSAVVICGNTANYNPSGVGAELEQLACGGIEHNSVWFAFQAQANGRLNFVIRPMTIAGVPAAVDFDWSLYALPGAPSSTNCDAKTQLSCNYAGSGTVFGIPGATGLATPNYSSGQFNPGIAVTAGSWYLLMVDQFSNATPQIFNVQFTGNPEFAGLNSSPGVFNEQPNFTFAPANCTGLFNFTNTSTSVSGASSYLWEFGDGTTSTSQSPSKQYVTAGVYYVKLRVTNSNGCSSFITKKVQYNNGALTMATGGILATPSCTDSNNGAISVNAIGTTTLGVSGGTEPYSYSLVTPSPVLVQNQSSPYFSGLPAGSYTVRSTDYCGASATVTISVAQTATNTTIGVGIQSVQASCLGSATGTAVINVNGTCPPYTMSLVESSPVTTPLQNTVQRDGITATYYGTFTNLLPGLYTVEATDACGKVRRATFTVGVSSAPSVGAVISPSCNNIPTGTITVTSTAATGLSSNGSPGAFQYALIAPSPMSRPFQNSSVFENLAPGAYTIAVKDECGNIGTGTTTVGTAGNPALGGSFTTPTCPNGSTGTIEAQLTGAGGGSPYTFQLVAPSPYLSAGQTSNAFTGLPAGIYTIKLTDVCGSFVTTTSTVNAASAPGFTTTNASSCANSANGSITVVPGATSIGPFSFELISPGAAIRPAQGSNVANSFSSIFTQLNQGNYTVKMTDGCGVPVTGAATITSPPAFTFPAGSTTVPSCSSSSTGRIVVALPTAGVAPYTYSIISPSPVTVSSQNSRIFDNLPVGSYTVLITDACGVAVSNGTAISIAAATAPTLTVTNTNSCATASGTITCAISTANQGGGTYNFSLIAPSPTTRPNQVSPIFTQLPAGVYTIQITDQCGVTGTTTTTIAAAGAFTPAAGGSIVDCNGAGGYLGQIIVTTPQNFTPGGPIPTGSGGGPYTYSIYDGTNSTLIAPAQSTNMFIVAPAAGTPTHTIRVTDVCGNTSTATVTINAPAALTSGVITATTLSCSGTNTGVIKVSTIATGGLAPYSYTLVSVATGLPVLGPQTSTTFNNVPANATGYYIRVTDACGTTTTSTTPLTFAPAGNPTVTATTVASCVSTPTGKVIATPGTGANAASGSFTFYLYDAGNTTLVAGPTSIGFFGSLAPGTYTVRIVDQCGSIGTVAATVTSTVTALTASGTATNSCGNGNTGVITAAFTGGSLPIQYALLDATGTTVVVANQSSNIFEGLAPATYIVRATDACGTTANSTGVTVGTSTLTPTMTTSTALFCGQDAIIGAFGAGGNGGPFTYALCSGAGCTTFSNFTTSSTFPISTSGTYRIQALDRCGNSITSGDLVVTIPTQAIVNSVTPTVACGASAISVSYSNISATPYYSVDGANFSPSLPASVAVGNHTLLVADYNAGTFSCASNAYAFTISSGLNYYADSDGDGYGAGTATASCTQPSGYVLNNTDCNNSNASVSPAGIEICGNGIDEDCSGADLVCSIPGCTDVTACNYNANATVSNGSCTYASTWYLDADADGYYLSTSTSCTSPGATYNTTGGISGDCNDANAAVNAGATEVCNTIDDDCDTQIDEGVQNNYYVDTDGDGYGAGAATVACTAPNGYVTTNTDCNNNNAAVNPAATEICNSIDDDCDTQIDEGLTFTNYYADVDGDGYGAGTATNACAQPVGFVTTNTDCNNNNASVNPGATEVCNTIDDDCDTQIDEGVQNNYYVDTDGDGYGAGAATFACTAPNGYVTSNTDCNNSNAAVNPGATEVCNSIDDDCDTQIDEGLTFTNYYADVDGDGYGAGTATNACAQPVGFVITNTDCNNNNASVNPGATEVCNSIDDDCDTQIDEGVQNNYYVDTDGDGYGAGAATVACTAPNGYVTSNTDCNNSNAAVNPGATEVCNSIDDDCDTQIDEGLTFTNYYADVDGDGYGAGTATNACAQPVGFVITNTDCNNNNASVNPGATEVCNSIDDDCDTQIDEGVQNNYYVDTDGDGYGVGAATVACTAPNGYVSSNTDCNNSNSAVNPGATEVCNSIDDDCDTQIDEGLTFTNYYADVDGDGYGAGTATNACAQPVGFVITNTDCNNNNASVNPGATEVCNSIDDDCDTQIDEGALTSFYTDADGDGYGSGTATIACTAPVGMVANNSDCNDVNSSVNPGATEICNLTDDDCDTQIDEGLPVINYYSDLDGDTFGGALVTSTCAALTGNFVLIGGDCNDANIAVNPGAVEICLNSIDDDCDGIVNDGCLPDQLLGESPATSQYVWTNFFPTCVTQSHTLTGFTSSLSSQSICLTGEDKWHYFTATSEAVSIQVSSTANDILLELQNANGTLVATENAVAGLGGEILNFSGLTAGQIYKVGVRNYNSALGIGAYTICVKMLKRGGCDYGPGPYNLCQYFKATYAGTGAVYTFTFTGLSGAATGNVYSRTQSSDICILSNVSPSLPFGCNYSVLITSTYNLLDGAGNTEIIAVPALLPCSMTTVPQPVTSIRTSDQCVNGTRFRGSVVASLPWVCGVINWRWEFTEVNPITLNTVGLPITVNRGAASNFINLGTVSALQNGKTYAVRTAPIMPNTGSNYQWGPTYYMCIIGSAGMVLEQGSEVNGNATRDMIVANEANMSLYPNPTYGTDVNINLSGVTSDNVQIRVVDAMGRQVWSNRYTANGVLNTNITFEQPLANGLYFVEAIFNGEVQTQRLMVQK